MKDASASKRARTLRDVDSHDCNDCNDAECAFCGDGPVQLDEQLLSQSAHALVLVALEESDKGTDRAVVVKLFETAVEKFGQEQSLAHAWALLHLAEYAEYVEYAERAAKLATQLGSSADRIHKAQILLIEARASVLAVCLEQSNWRDPAADDECSDEEGADSAGKSIVGEKQLREGLAQLVEAYRLLCAEHDAASLVEAYKSTIAFLLARRQAHSLTSMVLVALFDIATTLVYMHEGWAPVDGSGERLALAGSNGDGENARRIAHQAVLVWAMAAADCAAAGEQIEARLEPLITFLASRSADVECCKLHVQLLLVLCGCYEDEEKSMTAYEDATSALLKAHKLSPGDEDIKAQLADMGQPVN